MAKIYSHLKQAVPGDTVVGATLLDEVPTKEYGSVEWFVEVVRVADGVRRRQRLLVVHNGTQTTDATEADVEELDRVFTRSAARTKVSVEAQFSGSGASQVVQLVVTTSEAGWKAYWARLAFTGGVP